MQSVAAIGRQALLLLLLFACRQAQAVYYYYYYYRSYRYTYSSRIYIGYYYTGTVISVGGIIGAVVGALTFIGLVVGLIVFLCCLRKRRRAASGGVVRAPPPVPMTVGGPAAISTVSPPGGYPAAPAGGQPSDNPKQDGYPGVSPPPPYEGSGPAMGYSNGAADYQGNANYGYQNGQQAPYPTTADSQMPPLPAAEQQRY
ncbi:hypothetical protein BOX15_Mlig010502g1 [Macrostomum lignano]|uniref:Cysteine and tyrosine-rich protein 1 n=1 Tax=Macrostomum lignano TaxID=282301 RepID=A0A267DIS1_9PLAT|nr:hypothetical protein BOX15_Mlig010502g1 [Macrostomum lignano]